jgi:hypothetical protein
MKVKRAQLFEQQLLGLQDANLETNEIDLCPPGTCDYIVVLQN